MKIQLERRLASCPDTLHCAVCRQSFAVSPIRPLLYGDRGWLKGDVCPRCLQLSPDQVKQILWTQALHLMDPAPVGQTPTRLRHPEALECLEMAQEDLHRPAKWRWWLKRLEIFSQESQELEAARLRSQPCGCRQRSRLEKLLG